METHPDAGPDTMRVAIQLRQHPLCVGFILRFTEDRPFVLDDRIGTDHRNPQFGECVVDPFALQPSIL